MSNSALNLACSQAIPKKWDMFISRSTCKLYWLIYAASTRECERSCLGSKLLVLPLPVLNVPLRGCRCMPLQPFWTVWLAVRPVLCFCFFNFTTPLSIGAGWVQKGSKTRACRQLASPADHAAWSAARRGFPRSELGKSPADRIDRYPRARSASSTTGELSSTPAPTPERYGRRRRSARPCY